MTDTLLNKLPGWVIWATVTVAAAAALGVAAFSPLLAWRSPIYIAAGFAGILALVILLLQPLLAGGLLAGIQGQAARRGHRLLGVALLLAVLAHVGGLWITSPPDVVDALLFRSPTVFSVWGVIAMWAVFCGVSFGDVAQKAALAPEAVAPLASGAGCRRCPWDGCP